MLSTPNHSRIPKQVLLSLLDTIEEQVKREDTTEVAAASSFKNICDTKRDDNGHLLFGTIGSDLRRGEFTQ